MAQAFEFTERPEDGPLTLEQAVSQTLGYASMCWSETPTGIFESTRAKAAGELLVARIRRGDLA